MKFLATVLLTFLASGAWGVEVDSTRTIDAEQVVVRSSSKETNQPWSTPGAMSVVSPFKINQRGIEGIKDLTTFVPNLFIPDYGSKMTTPIYLRGVGARSSGQSVGMYVDNIPYMDKSTFDFDFGDVQRIEVLRGPQGTLYGRNAMGGIINVYTLSPFDFQGTRISLGAGNYGQYVAKGSTYHKLSNKVALSASAYWDSQKGFFTNEYTGRKVDNGQNAGGKLKVDWRINDRLTAYFTTSYDYTDQGAFAYGLYHKDTEEIDPVKYNDRGTYLRNMSNNSFRLEYRTDKILLTSNTGYQWLMDNMWMDQDFTANSIFTINQRQQQNSFNQEVTIKSITDKNYQWSVGAFGFYNALNTVGNVTLKKDFISGTLQPIFDHMMPPTVPVKVKITDTEIPNPGFYSTPSVGVAVFHQSTFNNLITKGLSLTVGLRLDYEKQFLDYTTSMALHTNITMPGGRPPMPYDIDKTLQGAQQQQFFEWLPKLSLKYECSPNVMTYLTVAKGYKAGGYNIQMFSEVIQDSLKARPTMPGVPPAKPEEGARTLSNTISYKPEVTWNYEFGTRANLWNDLLTLDLAVFYMDVRNLQLTQFVDGGSGRILTNAGHGQSCGAELSALIRPVDKLSIDLAYGYTHSTFTDYDDGKNDYSGNFVPYTPQHTFSVGASYGFVWNRGFIKGLVLSAQYNGAGNIYWNEANDVVQPFYGLLGAKVTLRSEVVRLELWGRNLLDTDYGAFYFESFGNSFIQRGTPRTYGANLVFTF